MIAGTVLVLTLVASWYKKRSATPPHMTVLGDDSVSEVRRRLVQTLQLSSTPLTIQEVPDLERLTNQELVYASTAQSLVLVLSVSQPVRAKLNRLVTLIHLFGEGCFARTSIVMVRGKAEPEDRKLAAEEMRQALHSKLQYSVELDIMMLQTEETPTPEELQRLSKGLYSEKKRL